jgi:hypothetical protein
MLVSGLALGLLAGLAVHRGWRPLLQVEIRWLPVLLGSLVLRAIAPLFGAAGFPLYLAALLGTASSAAANSGLTGALLVAAGGCLNLAVVVLNVGMPVDPSAVATAGTRMPADALHVTLTSATLVAPLADIIPIAVIHNVYSVGDVVIALGGFLIPFLLLVRK